MKFKFLTLAVIAMLFTACKPQSESGSENSGTNNNDGEKSYISISLASSDGEKRDGGNNDGGYEEGEVDERRVKTAYAFFFTDGQPFTNNSQTNHQQIDLTMGNEPESENVSNVSNKVLVINAHEGQLPNQLMVVLNWIPQSNKSYSIVELRESICVNHMNQIEGTDCFIMSNSVYQSVAGNVYATPLDITDFYTSSDAALAKPVTVYVERVAAKVRVKTEGDTDGGSNNAITKYQLQKDDQGTPLMINGKQIFAEIIGWDLYKDYEKSTLLKDIEGIGNDLGITWNDPNNFRSYWAICNSDLEVDEIDYDGITSNIQNNLYCGENTRGNKDASERTKIFFKAQLKDENDSIVEYAKWLGNEYIGKDNLLKAVKNTLAYTYYSGITDTTGNTTYTSIEFNDLMVVAGTGNVGEPAAYEVYFQIKEDVEKTWFKLVNNEFKLIGKDALNAALKAIEPAILYSNGYTYYYTDIQHLKTATATTYGIVRNHIYEVNIQSITGLGTPVGDVTSIIEVPVTPTEEDIKTYLAAEIKILSWKLITNDIDL